jgi:malate synthase
MSSLSLPPGVQVLAPTTPEDAAILTFDALSFLADLHRRFEPQRQALLTRRVERAHTLRNGLYPTYLPETAHIRDDASWQVAPIPDALLRRTVEITGPVDAKMVINALNSGADVFMADFEDASSPTWRNMLDGQHNLAAAVRHTLCLDTPKKRYALNPTIATLFIRPRGWHLHEKHLLIDGQPISASLFDFGLYAFHNAHERIRRGLAPCFYLPKLEGHLEAALWNDAFNAAQDALSIPRSTFKATVLIETILAAFEMEEILFALRDHIVALNAGRWDYIFSIIKKFRHDPAFILPDRSQVTMTSPFMRAYTELMIRACHRRGALAIGGMAAFIPSRTDADINAFAIAKVTADKRLEASSGADGTWVAHPDLVPVARAAFQEVLGDRPNQRDRSREDALAQNPPESLIQVALPCAQISLAGVRTNINITLQYLSHWLQGRGAVALHNLMEDAATAEISRAQLWQWLHHDVSLSDGQPFTSDLYKALRAQELTDLQAAFPDLQETLPLSAGLLDDLVLRDDFDDFLTLSAYQTLP